MVMAAPGWRIDARARLCSPVPGDGRACRRSAGDRCELFSHYRWTEQAALCLIAASRTQESHLGRALDPLGDRLQAKIVRQADGRRDDRIRIRIRRQVSDQ